MADLLDGLAVFVPLVSREWRNGKLLQVPLLPFLHSLLTKGRCWGLASRDGGVVHQAQHHPKWVESMGSYVYVLGPCSLQMPTGHRTMALQSNSRALLDDHDPSHVSAVVVRCLPVRKVSCCRMKPGFVSVGVRV